MDLQELTKKNREFITIASHQLQKDGKSQEEIEAILADVLPTIIENQKEGHTARSLFGAPTIWAKTFTESSSTQANQAQRDDTNKNPWLMWLDSSLMLLGFFGLIYGLTSLANKHYYQQGYGIVTTIVTALTGGAALYALYHFVYRYAGKPKSERPSLWRSLMYMAVFTLIWIGFVGATALIPKALNPVLPGLVMIVISGLSFALKYFLKKQYNIQSALATQKP
ncbi:DUF1129 domain-containing protein [Streptococcus dentasini]